MFKTLIVDDNASFRQSLNETLATQFPAMLVAEAADVGHARETIASLEPDLILMDLGMPICDGLTATRLIKAQRPAIKIVILTTSADDADLFEAVKSGACGYLLKSMGGAAFVEALQTVEQGIPPFSPGLAGRMLDEFARLSVALERMTSQEQDAEEQPAESKLLEAEGLTERQAEVLRLVALGLTYREVGEQLYLSERTVRFHMTQIMNRLHLYNRAQVLAFAGKLGIKPRE